MMNAFDTFEGTETDATGEVVELRKAIDSSITPRKREKRTEAQMLEDMRGNPLQEAGYLLARAQKLESKLAELLKGASPKARELILDGNEHLGRYI